MNYYYYFHLYCAISRNNCIIVRRHACYSAAPWKTPLKHRHTHTVAAAETEEEVRIRIHVFESTAIEYCELSEIMSWRLTFVSRGKSNWIGWKAEEKNEISETVCSPGLMGCWPVVVDWCYAVAMQSARLVDRCWWCVEFIKSRLSAQIKRF